jgi:hypothetical protein
MPVHIRSTAHGDLRLTLSNAGEVLDTQVAATPQEANRIGIMMLASRDELNAGDTLSCRRADEARDVTLVPGPGGGR